MGGMGALGLVLARAKAAIASDAAYDPTVFDVMLAKLKSGKLPDNDWGI